MTRINQRVRFSGLLLIVLVAKSLPVCSQRTYKYKADLPKIDSSGIYKINLAPEMVAKCNRELSDIRLLDQNGKFSAYALSKNLFIDNPEQFVAFPAIKPYSDPDSIYIAENRSGLSTNNLSVQLKNTDVDRSVNLSGSQDLKKWYAIKEDIPLTKAGSAKGSEYEQTFYFPTSNYQYFKILVIGKNKTPVKIIRAGVYLGQLNRREFVALPRCTFKTKDSNSVSHIYIHFVEPYLINQLRLIISAPDYYKRKINIYDPENKVSLLSEGTISFRQESIYLSAKTRQLRIDISNGDDVPLTIKRIDAYEQNQYLLSYLEAGHRYAILSGDSSAAVPVYDLSFLEGKPNNARVILGHSVIYNNPAFMGRKPAVTKNFTMFLWGVIITVLILLSLFTWKLVKEIGARQTQ